MLHTHSSELDAMDGMLECCIIIITFYHDRPKLVDGFPQQWRQYSGVKHVQFHMALQRLSKLVRLIAGGKCIDANQGSRPDVAAAAAAVGLLVAQQPGARAGLLQLRGLKPLLAVLHQGSLAEQSVAANVLFDMSQGTYLPSYLPCNTSCFAAALQSHVHMLQKRAGPHVCLLWACPCCLIISLSCPLWQKCMC